MAQHRKDTKRRPNQQLYKLMVEYGVDKFSIELIKDFPCERSEQLQAEEGRQIRQHKTADEGANVQVPGRTQKEYYTDNADAIKAKQALYRAANIEATSERRKAYYVANAEAIAAKEKAYNLANAEAISARKKAYNLANAEAIAARKKEAYQRKKADRLASNSTS